MEFFYNRHVRRADKSCYYVYGGKIFESRVGGGFVVVKTRESAL